MIRKATVDDLVELAAFCFECQDAMHWRAHGLTGDPADVLRTLEGLIKSPDADVSVVELIGAIEGVCAVALQGFAWNRGVFVASEMIWHMRPEFPDGPAKGRWVLRMLDHMRAWAARSGASVFKINTRHADATLGQALERRGFAPFETVYLMEVSHHGN